jgi:drug/metabolite transporter (DMT)-like permease
MYIPITTTNTAAAPLDFRAAASLDDAFLRTNYFGFGGGKDLTSHDWSSLIGIVTAIVGNVLISFALNTQRYAHLRLSQDSNERAEKRRAERKRRRRNGNGNGKSRTRGDGRHYGSEAQQQHEEQVEIAEERARENARHGPANGRLELEEEEEPQEGDPLIPSLGSRKSSSSTAGSSSLLNGGDEKGEDGGKSKSYLRSPIWWLGISLMVLGEAGNFLAYGFAPASIVSPLGVVALISNCLIAPLLLHEKFRWRDAVGVVIAVGGCVTVVLSASDSNPRLDPDIIWDLITTWEFETYLGVTVGLIIVLLFASNKYGHKSILIDIGLVGLFGGYTALSTKGIASLLSNKIWKVITFPITYLLLAVLVFTAVMQIKYINRALQRFNATMVIPTQFVMFTLSVIIGSAVLYRDFERESAEDAYKFVGGCALTFLGVWCITSGRSDNNDGDSDVELGGEDEETDTVDLVDHEASQNGRPSTKSSVKSAPTRNGLESSSLEVPPSLIITHDFQPSTPKNPSGLDLDSYSLNAGPANRSAIHASSAADLTATGTDPTKRSPMHATTSAPIIPTLPPPRPETPRTTTTPALEPPRTPQNRDTNLDPNSSPNRAALLARNSITTLFPDLGPLTSPLSSSLSAIVADSLRRGVDHSNQRSLRPLRRNTSSRGQQAHSALAPESSNQVRTRHSIASGALSQDENEDEELGQLTRAVTSGGGRSRRGQQKSQRASLRARSLSATLGDLFTRGGGGGGGGSNNNNNNNGDQGKPRA